MHSLGIVRYLEYDFTNSLYSHFSGECYCCFRIVHDKFSSDTRPLILDISGDIEPYGDLHLCDDFIYRVGKIPLKQDDVWDRNQTRFGTYYVLGDEKHQIHKDGVWLKDCRCDGNPF